MARMGRRGEGTGLQAWRLALALLLAGTGGRLGAQDAAEAQFRKSCMSCHSVGAGPKVGPDLKGLSGRRTKDWATKFIQGPGAMLDSDATAQALLKSANNVKMPDLGISPAEADALWAFIDEATKSGKVVGSAGISRAATAVDLANGQALFEGRVRFAKGGPSCLSCHSASGAGPFGGGRLGPDLTAVAAKMGKGLASAIESPSFPTMQGVFAQKGLSQEEAFQVAAYLQSVSGNPPAKKDLTLPVLGLVGLAGSFALGARLGRRRFKGVRKNLVPKA